MSLFVNPAQFGPGEDLEAYPRDEARDLELAAEAGVDLVFAPAATEVYPSGFATSVEVGGGLTEVLDGDPQRRGPGHFRGVTTVVAKLFNAVGPDVAFFGQKDAQQAVVIRRMARDLDFPVEIVVVPTVREPDGLAMSSRNAYLDPAERERAAALSRALRAAERAAEAGETSTEPALAAASGRARRGRDRARVPGGARRRGPAPAQNFNGRPVLVAVAARVGPARLIDNVVIGGTEPARLRAGAETETADRIPMTLPRLAEMKLNAEPIVMVTAYDYPSAEVAEAGRRRPRPGRRHRGDDGARPRLDHAGQRRRDADAGEGGPPRAADAAAGRRPAVRLLRALQRAGDRDRACASSRRRAATSSSSSAAAPRSSARGRSSAPGSRSWATSG